MLSAPFRVVLDANVLFPFTLRDTLLRAAAYGFYQLYWSEEILDETSRNLVATGTTTETQARHLRSAMVSHFPEAMVTDYESLVAGLRNHEKDRHVAAAAVKAGAQVIVTLNLRDFGELPDGLEAQTPDAFLSNLFDLDPDGMVELVREQAKALQRPPRTLHEVLRGLERSGVPDFARAVWVRAGCVQP